MSEIKDKTIKGGIFFPVAEKRENMSLDRKIDILHNRIEEINRFLGWINNEQLCLINNRLNIIYFTYICILLTIFLY